MMMTPLRCWLRYADARRHMPIMPAILVFFALCRHYFAAADADATRYAMLMAPPCFFCCFHALRHAAAADY